MAILTLIIDGYIYYDVRSISGKPKRKRDGWLYIASCVPCWALLIVAFSLPLRDEGRDVIPVMWLLFTVSSSRWDCWCAARCGME